MAKRKAGKIKGPDLDIVIPVYGRADLLKKCLESVYASDLTESYKITIVDDCGPAEGLEEIYSNLNGSSTLLENKTNSGFSKTVNRGVAVGRAPLILILNTDIVLEPAALKNMIAEFEDERVGVVGPKLLFPPESRDPSRPAGAIQHAGLAVNIMGQVIHVNIGWPSDHPKVQDRRLCQAVTGACMMTRRSVWKRAKTLYKESGDPTSGGFNEVYGSGTYEDVEYCFAARSEGWEVVFTPEAVAYHYVGASVKQTGGGFPIARNELIFRARCGQLLAWDDWRFL